MKQVRDVMNTDLITIETSLTFDNILKIMTEKGVGKLPVIDNGQLVGVVTRDDILVRKETAPLPPVIAFWDLLITLPENKEFKKKLKKLIQIVIVFVLLCSSVSSFNSHPSKCTVFTKNVAICSLVTNSSGPNFKSPIPPVMPTECAFSA